MKLRWLLTLTPLILTGCPPVTDPETGPDTDTEVIINYSYDELNRVDEVVRADGPVITYKYDVVSNITQAAITESPDSDNNGTADFAEGSNTTNNTSSTEAL